MNDTIAQIVEDIKEDLGDPDVSELPESAIIRYIDEGIRYFNKSIIKRKKNYGSLNVVEGQDLYTLPDGIIKVSDVYFLDNSYYNLNPNTFEFQYFDFNVSSLYDSPALGFILFQKLSSLDLVFPTDFEFLDGQLRIIPTPISPATLLYEYISNIELSNINKNDLMILEKYVAGKSMLRIGRKRNSKVRAIPMVGGEIRFDSGKTMLEEGHDLINEFRREIGLDLSVMVTG